MAANRCAWLARGGPRAGSFKPCRDDMCVHGSLDETAARAWGRKPTRMQGLVSLDQQLQPPHGEARFLASSFTRPFPDYLSTSSVRSRPAVLCSIDWGLAPAARTEGGKRESGMDLAISRGASDDTVRGGDVSVMMSR
jgi:hypothetical protein